MMGSMWEKGGSVGKDLAWIKSELHLFQSPDSRVGYGHRLPEVMHMGTVLCSTFKVMK